MSQPESYWTERCAACDICSDEEDKLGCNGYCPECFPEIPDWN